MCTVACALAGASSSRVDSSSRDKAAGGASASVMSGVVCWCTPQAVAAVGMEGELRVECTHGVHSPLSVYISVVRLWSQWN